MKSGSYSTKAVDKKERDVSPPAEEHDTHKGNKSEKFYGDGSGNKALPHDLSHDADEGAKQGDGANTRDGGHYTHVQGVKGPFLGDTKGNKDLPNNRTEGVQTGEGGRYIASSRRYHGGRKVSPEGN